MNEQLRKLFNEYLETLSDKLELPPCEDDIEWFLDDYFWSEKERAEEAIPKFIKWLATKGYSIKE